MPLFDIPENMKKKKEQQQTTTKSNVKLKKGQTLDTLILAARKIVEEKLGKYKDTSKCVLQDIELIRFFDETPDNSIMAIDTETTGLNVLTDELVGISVCNGKECLYIPINHISSVSLTRLAMQISPDKIREIFTNVFKTRKFNWVYHNAKFDLAVLRTFFGYKLPDPYWDTMLAAYLFDQDEEHSLLVWASY